MTGVRVPSVSSAGRRHPVSATPDWRLHFAGAMADAANPAFPLEPDTQYIVRFPAAAGEQILKAVKDAAGPGEDTGIIIVADDTDGKWRLEHERLYMQGATVNLPCVTETHKTLDRSTYYKTGNVGQMIVFDTDRSRLPKPGSEWASGITPPAKDVVKRRFAKARRNLAKDPPSAERVKEVEDLLKRLEGAQEQVNEMTSELARQAVLAAAALSSCALSPADSAPAR